MQDEAVEHFERAVRAYLPGRSTMAIGFDPGAFAMSWESHALWLWGAPHRALERHREAMELASTRGPHSLALANAYGAVLFQYLGDEDEMSARAQAAIDLCERYGFAYYGEWGQILLAWRDRTTPGSNSVARIESALESLRSIGAEVRRPILPGAPGPDPSGGRRRRIGAIDPRRGRRHGQRQRGRLLAARDPALIAEFGPESGREATLRAALALARQPRQPIAGAARGDQPRPAYAETRPASSSDALADMPESRAIGGGARSHDVARASPSNRLRKTQERGLERSDRDPRTLLERRSSNLPPLPHPRGDEEGAP